MAVWIIAEGGVNHNGSVDMALRLVDAAADAGADAIKFQTFRSESVVTAAAPKAEYQETTTPSGSQLDMIRQLELDEEAHDDLAAHARERGITFLSTPFDPASVDLLVDRLEVALLKIPSGEITNGPLIRHVAAKGLPVILSTGMATLNEVEEALAVLAFGFTRGADREPSLPAFATALASEEGRAELRRNVTLLHCTTEYPAPFNSVNLLAMDTLARAFGLAVGYSDHTTGIAVPVAAAARGASVIEKHLTLDHDLPGPDHRASAEPSEFKAMVEAVRQVEQALGDGIKRPAAAEIKNMAMARRSLVAARAIPRGEAFSGANLTAKRPGTGVSPMRHWDCLGLVAEHDYQPDEPLDETVES
jgi:N-acetylneuraminate synthase